MQIVAGAGALVGLLASALVIAAAPEIPAGAAELRATREWTPPEAVVPGEDASRPDAVVSTVGRTTVVYEQDGGVWAVHRPAGGDWQAPHQIGRGQLPRVDADAGGRVTVAWSGPRQSVLAADWTPRDGWSKRVTLSPAPVHEGVFGAGLPEVDVGENGAVAVAFPFITGVYPDQERQIRVAYRAPGGHWRVTHVTGFGRRIDLGDITVDADGDVDLLYLKRGVLAVRKPAGKPWGARSRLVSGVDAAVLYAAVGPDGRTVAAWSQKVEGERLRAYASKRGARGWSSPAAVSDAGVRGLVTDVAVDGTGRATMVVLGRHRIDTADLPAGGTWQSPVLLTTWARGTLWELPQLVVDESGGDALVAWLRYNRHGGRPARIFTEAAYRSGDTWGTVERLADEDGGRPGNFATAVQPGGDGLLVLEHWVADESHRLLQARWFRTTP